MMNAVQVSTSRRDPWTRRRFGLAVGGALTTLLGVTHGQDAVAKKRQAKRKRQGTRQHVQAPLAPVGNSGASGFVSLQQPPPREGPTIVVHAKGLTPGTEYVSLYYDNATCELEPYSAEDVIGGPYVANPAGIGQTHGEADDALEDIHSVSVRLASDFSLQACASF